MIAAHAALAADAVMPGTSYIPPTPIGVATVGTASEAPPPVIIHRLRSALADRYLSDARLHSGRGHCRMMSAKKQTRPKSQAKNLDFHRHHSSLEKTTLVAASNETETAAYNTSSA